MHITLETRGDICRSAWCHYLLRPLGSRRDAGLLETEGTSQNTALMTPACVEVTRIPALQGIHLSEASTLSSAFGAIQSALNCQVAI
jgi:hypothetical protein